MSSQTSSEGEIRKHLIEEDRVDCMVALPGQFFYSTQISVCLCILSRDKSANGLRDRRGEVLVIDARNMGHMVDSVRREFSDEDIERIAGTYAQSVKEEVGFFPSCTRGVVEVIT